MTARLWQRANLGRARADRAGAHCSARAARARVWLAAALAAVGLGAAADVAALAPADLPGCPAKTKHCIAVALWIAAAEADDAQGWLAEQLDVANDRLAVIDAGVQVSEIRDLPKQDTQILRVAQRSALDRHGAQTPLRWFVVERLNDHAEPGRRRQGVTWRNGAKVWVIEARDAWSKVLAHELGHVLGLPHSGEFRSIMNKSPDPRRLLVKLGFTPREQPQMRQTLARLLQQGRIRLTAPRE